MKGRVSTERRAVLRTLGGAVVVAGPPSHALRSAPVRIQGDPVVLGG